MAGKADMTSADFVKSGLQLRTRQRERGHDYKAELLDQIAHAGISEPVREFKFHASRDWRYDYAWPDLKVACEYQGGVFDEGRSGHTSKGGVLRDVEKLNESQAMGWHVVYVTPNMVVSGAALRYIKLALEKEAGRAKMDGDKLKRKAKSIIALGHDVLNELGE